MSLVEGLPFKFTFTFPTVSSALKVRVLTSIPTPPIDPSLLFFHAATVIILQLPMLCSLTSFFMNKFMFLEADNIICSGRGKLRELWFFEGVFFYLVFFRRQTIHGKTGEGRGHLYSSRPLPPTPEHSIFFCNFASEITTHNLNHSACSYQNVTS